ncbi:MAG: 5'-deoxyadenosine deaminase [Syntrophomonadaceae bacterium]|nr:5'-deoxyadenosine deaminase [Syntrophomonadaceae bacterium]
MKTLIQNALLVTMNPERQILNGDLLIVDDHIEEIGSRIVAEADRVINARGQIVLPGFVQAHVHLCQTLFRGQADDLELLDWLNTRILPLEGAHDPESIYYSSLLGIGEMFRTGTTSIIDMASVNYTDSVFQAILESGIRAMSGKCMIDQGEIVPDSMMENPVDSLQESVDLLEKWNGQGGGRLHYAFNPRFGLSCSTGLLTEIRDLAQHYGAMIHTHASENRSEVAQIKAEHGLDNIVYLDRLGLTGENLILAHCIWISEEELSILAQSGTKVAHCPSSNLKLASGIALIPEMLKRGINVALGADGAPCNNNMDPFMEMRLAALIQKPEHGPTAMPAQTVVEMATLGGAQAMGLSHEIGSLEVGKKADLAMISREGLHTSPHQNIGIYGQLVYQARASDVCLTMVNGRIVYEGAQLTTIQQGLVLRKAQENVNRIVGKVKFK